MAHLTQAQIEELEESIHADNVAGIASNSLGGQTTTLIPLKDRLDALERVTPLPTTDIGRAMGFVKTIPPGAG